MKRILIAIIVLALASVAGAATIEWGPVEGDGTYQIKGYVVSYRFAGQEKWKRYGTSGLKIEDMETVLNLIPNEDYEFSVSAYSFDGDEGPKSEPVPFTYDPKNKKQTILTVGGVTIIVKENDQ